MNYRCIPETTSYHQPENFKLKNCIFKTFKIVKEKGSEPSFILSGYVVLCRIKRIREPNSIQSLHWFSDRRINSPSTQSENGLEGSSGEI